MRIWTVDLVLRVANNGLQFHSKANTDLTQNYDDNAEIIKKLHSIVESVKYLPITGIRD